MTPTVPTSALEAAFQNPIVYGLLLLFIATYLLAEITGKLTGPLNKLIVRRRAALQAANAPAPPDPRIAQLEQAAGFQEQLLKNAMATIARLDIEVNDLRRDRDRQGVLLTAHLAWDRQVQTVLADNGIDVPTPSPLFVTDDEPVS